MNLNENIQRIKQMMGLNEQYNCLYCNERTKKNINKFSDPKMKEIASKFVDTVQTELKKNITIVDSFRTKEEQDALYAQGRTKPGKIVTNTPGGKSNHNFGKAFDVYLTKKDGSVDMNNSITRDIADIAKRFGLSWGGDWAKFKDTPHFEIPTPKNSNYMIGPTKGSYGMKYTEGE